MSDRISIPNAFKINFCNAYDAMTQHKAECAPCELYLRSGDGDLCDKGKEIVAIHLGYSDTSTEFPKPKQQTP